MYGPGASSPPFESVDFVDSGLFCSKCLRNQHLFTSALASYFPSPDDPAYSAYEREYPKFRKNLEERYPQVCQNCESRVKARIRQAGYEAKADHLRRMMDWSKTGRAARKARNRNWRSLLVFAGAVCYWGSIAGQLAWNLMGALDGERVVVDEQHWLSISSLVSCTKQAIKTRQVGSHCSSGLTPYAGIALVLGILSLWWNPRLRMKVEGRTGRFVGLGEYYKVQLIVMVMRFVAWAVLKDPLMSGMQPTLPPTLHAFMMAFTILVSCCSFQSLFVLLTTSLVCHSISTHYQLRYSATRSMVGQHSCDFSEPKAYNNFKSSIDWWQEIGCFWKSGLSAERTAFPVTKARSSLPYP